MSHHFQKPGDGHAYHYVVLDGKGYYADLTWDDKRIDLDAGEWQNFLVSSEEFEKNHKRLGFNAKNTEKYPYADESLTVEERKKLIESLDEINSKRLQRMLDSNYLNGFVNDYFKLVIRSQEVITNEKVEEFMAIIQDIEERILADDNQPFVAKIPSKTFSTINLEYLKRVTEEHNERYATESHKSGKIYHEKTMIEVLERRKNSGVISNEEQKFLNALYRIVEKEKEKEDKGKDSVSEIIT